MYVRTGLAFAPGLCDVVQYYSIGPTYVTKKERRIGEDPLRLAEAELQLRDQGRDDFLGQADRGECGRSGSRGAAKGSFAPLKVPRF